MLEKQLIIYCSPTLAGLKSASLFSIIFNDYAQKKQAEEEFNRKFARKGLSLKWLGVKNGRTLVYVYRKRKLYAELKAKASESFLLQYGYDTSNLEACLDRLKERIAQCEEFPHEIGMFLGYPLEDVRGFIKNKGKNYYSSGHWKIYANEKDTLRLFEKYTHCTNVYTKLYENGRPIEKLAVRS